MRRLLQLFVREHHNRWFTASVLAMPRYSAYGPKLTVIRDELAEAVEEDLQEGLLELPPETHHPDLRLKPLHLELKAVQHERLITVPMRLSLLVRPLDKTHTHFEVHLPRLGERFRIQGEENVEPWASELARGHFHLKSVEWLLGHQYERGERLDELEVVLGRTAGGRRRGPRSADHAVILAQAQRDPLLAHGPELVEEAREGRLPRAELRDREVARLLEILSSRRRSSTLLVGPSGGGKTALVHELAHQLALGKGGERLDGTRVWSIPTARMVAGARFLGEWQQLAQNVLRQVGASRDILYLGNLVEALTWRTDERGLGLGDLLGQAVTAGEICLLAEATPDALSLCLTRHPALVRALEHLPVPPLSPDDTRRILERAAVRLAKKQKLKWAEGAVNAALDVVARFGDAESLPGSGISLLERMAQLSRGKGASIGPGEAIAAFAQMSGFPRALLDPRELLVPEELTGFFSERVVGQPDAVDRLVRTILLLKAGLNDPGRPLGSFLFAGPTGVGKTESALALAEYLFQDRSRLLRLDMSEYSYPGAALRLIDGPGGEGELVRKVREQPFQLVLLDEVEKADSSVFDLLLQVLGEGRLTDGTGRTVRFTHTLVILTSNLGAARRESIGFEPGRGTLALHYRAAVERHFRPELINRLDHLVPFAALGKDSIGRIAERLLRQAVEREGFARRGLVLSFSAALLEALAERGYDPVYGARPLKRAVEELVIAPLARRLAQGARLQAARLHLGWREGALALETAVTTHEQPARAGKEER